MELGTIENHSAPPAPTASGRRAATRSLTETLSRPAWYRIAQAFIVVVSVALAASWIATDRTPPSFDQSRYLWDSLQYVNALHHDGPAGVVKTFFEDRFRGPGYPALVFPFMLVLGASAQSALVANVFLWITLLLTVAAIARQLFGTSAGLVAMAVTATIPLLHVLTRQALVDLAALAWTSLALLAMLRSANFTRSLPSALAGAFGGIGLLTKATVLVFLAGPILVMGLRAAIRLSDASTERRLRVIGNMALAAAVALALAAPWYVTNWYESLTYLQSATTGSLSVGFGPQAGVGPAEVTALSVWLLNDLSLWLAIGIAAAAVVVLGDRLTSGDGRSRVRTKIVKRTWTWSMLASLVVIPIGVLMASGNWDPRQAVVAFPAAAIAFAGLSGAVRSQALRLTAVGGVVLVGVAQVGVAQLPPGSPIRNQVVVKVPAGLPFRGLVLFAPAYAAPDPAADDGTPVMQELEALSGGRPARVLVAQEDHVFNVNTLTWLAATRHDQFTFVRPDVVAGDPSALDSYDLAIYLPASAVAGRNPVLHNRIVNRTAASTVFGDQLFGFFGRSWHEVAVEGGTAWVLQR